MPRGIELERVQRRSGGRIHLIPHVPESGVAVTLCEQRLAEGTYQATDAEADCRNCIRRKDDPARVSGAFFQSELGSELLERSLAQVRARGLQGPGRARLQPTPAVQQPVAGPEQEPTPVPAQPPVEPPQIAELRSAPPLRRAFENVYVSPSGVMLRLGRDGSLAHVTFSGRIEIRRRGNELTVRIGDVVLEFGT